jgi:hypothetical protein
LPPPGPAAGIREESLEDYFDRLDAAFADLDTAAPAAPPAFRAAAADDNSDAVGHDALGGWDPDLSGDPARPARAPESPAFDIEPAGAPAPPPVFTPPPAAQPPRVPEHVAPAASAVAAEPAPAPGRPQGASLAEAVAALLAAEQGRPIAPAAVRPEDIPDGTIEDIVRRVIDRVGSQSVQQTVLDVAERLVREEIDRIKRG